MFFGVSTEMFALLNSLSMTSTVFAQARLRSAQGEQTCVPYLPLFNEGRIRLARAELIRPLSTDNNL
jgi:hypothetical protein